MIIDKNSINKTIKREDIIKEIKREDIIKEIKREDIIKEIKREDENTARITVMRSVHEIVVDEWIFVYMTPDWISGTTNIIYGEVQNYDFNLGSIKNIDTIFSIIMHYIEVKLQKKVSPEDREKIKEWVQNGPRYCPPNK